MKIILDSKELLNKLSNLNAVISNNNALPIAECVLFKNIGNKLILMATDLETTITTSLEIDPVLDEINIAIPAKILIETLKALPHQPLSFEINANTLTIVSGSGNYTLNFFDGDNFPTVPPISDNKSKSINSKILLNAITKTVFACANEDLRPSLNGVLFEFLGDKINFVATDVHKLAKFVYKLKEIGKNEEKLIVPRKPLNLLKNVLNAFDCDVLIEHNDKNILFIVEDYEINSRLIDAVYPNYTAIIPKEDPERLKINRINLINSLKRVSLFGDRLTHQVKLNVTYGDLTITAQDIGYNNKSEEHLDCDLFGESIIIGFNHRFLTEVLSNLQTELVEIEFFGPTRAAIVKPFDSEEDVFFLIMPVRL